MKIFLDTNVLLDCLLDRYPFADDAEEVIEICTASGNNGAFSTLSACNMIYIMSKAVGQSDAETLVQNIVELTGLVAIEPGDVTINLCGGHPDFEDAVQIVAAQRWGADIIVTRDKKGFVDSPVKVLTPAEFLRAQEGTV